MTTLSLHRSSLVTTLPWFVLALLTGLVIATQPLTVIVIFIGLVVLAVLSAIWQKRMLRIPSR